MWYVNANVIDVLTGERLRGRAVETAPDGTVAQVAAAPPAGLTGVIDVGGYAADFVAVPSDPLDDLTAMRAISLVVQGGRVVRDDAVTVVGS